MKHSWRFPEGAADDVTYAFPCLNLDFNTSPGKVAGNKILDSFLDTGIRRH